MAHLEVRTFIAAAPDAVWAMLADLEHQAAWMVDVRRLEGRHGAEARRGRGHARDERAVPAADRQGRDGDHGVGAAAAGWTSSTAASSRARGQFLLERAHDGTTFIWIEDFAPPLGASANWCSRSSYARTCAACSRVRWRTCGGWRKRALVEVARLVDRRLQHVHERLPPGVARQLEIDAELRVADRDAVGALERRGARAAVIVARKS